MNSIRAPVRLPPLAAHFQNRDARPAGQTKSFALLQELRTLANALRRAKPQPFYSMRAVAACFGVSLRLVARVYAELEREGVLLRLRGAMTMLTPLKAHPRVPVRGVVGLPVWDYGYCTLADWRFYYMALEEALRRRHFVADFVFYQGREPSHPDFAERLVAHNLDYLLWFKPMPTYISNLRCLADGGVQVAVVHDWGTPFPFPQYRLDLAHATRRAFAAWRKAGLRSIAMISSDSSPNSAESWIDQVARQAGFRVISLRFSDREPAAAVLDQLREESKTGLVIADQYAEIELCRTAPESLADVLRRHRTLFHYRLDLWPAILKDCFVDLACFDWRDVAERIATDIASGALRRQREPVTIAATWRARTKAATFAQVF